MIQLWYSNHLEQLVRALADNVAMRRDPLEPIRIVVPNRNIATYLKFELARIHGIAANLETLYINTFFEGLLAPDTQLLRREVVRGLLIERLEEIYHDAPANPETHEIRGYMSVSVDEDDYDRRLFQLADRLARLFDEYELSRPQMIEAWSTKTTMTHEPYKTTEAWQRALWIDLYGPRGKARRPDLRVQRFGELLVDIVARKPTLDHPVHIFGMSYLARLYYDALGALGDTSEIFVYALNPCMEYWEDVPNGWRVSARSRFRKRRDSLPLGFVQADDTLFEDEEDPPPLKLWGRPGRDNIRLLNQLTDCNFQTAFCDPAQTNDTVLGRLQHDILVRAPMGPPTDALADDSLVILQCPTIQREVEIIASEIWELRRRAHEAGEELRFNDIAVIVNQSQREAYQSRIRAVFKDTWDIPHNIVDITARSNRRYLEAVDLLLALPFSRFTRAEMLRLMTHPNVLAGHPDVNPETWIGWVNALNIFHGADHSDHAETYIEKDLYNWDQGLRRLVLGAFVATDVADPMVTLGDNTYVPLEHSATDMTVSAQFVRLARDLVAYAREFSSHKVSTRTWLERVILLVQRLLIPADEEDERDQIRVLDQLHQLRDREASLHPVRFRIAYEAIVGALSGLEISRGHYLADGVVVSSFVPMRPIPFKVVFITGLGERQFPRADIQSPLDLRWASSQQGDNFSLRRQDEYMFLETLQSTRDRLYLSYIARDSRTGEELLPSSLVRELEFTLRRHYLVPEQVDALKRMHPLRRFDERYFPEVFGGTPDPKLNRSVHPQATREAQVRALRQAWLSQNFVPPRREDIDALAPSVGDALTALLNLPRVGKRGVSHADTVVVTFRMLRRFLENPIQGAAEFYLGLRREFSDDVMAVEDETFQTPWWDAQSLMQNVFLQTWQARSTAQRSVLRDEAYQQQTHVLELAGHTPTGLFIEAERGQHLQGMSRWQTALEREGLWDLRDLVVHRLGTGEGNPVGTLRHPPFAINIPVSMDAAQAVTITGQSPVYSPSHRVLFSFTTASLPKGEAQGRLQTLEAFVAWAVLVAAGIVDDADWRHVIVSSRSHSAASFPFGGISQTQARDWLIDLLHDMLTGVHTYQMPALAALMYRIQRKPFPAAVDSAAYEGARRGPIQGEERFALPPDVDGLIDRRLGLYFEVMR